jgi:hypothetical protein
VAQLKGIREPLPKVAVAPIHQDLGLVAGLHQQASEGDLLQFGNENLKAQFIGDSRAIDRCADSRGDFEQTPCVTLGFLLDLGLGPHVNNI